LGSAVPFSLLPLRGGEGASWFSEHAGDDRAEVSKWQIRSFAASGRGRGGRAVVGRGEGPRAGCRARRAEGQGLLMWPGVRESEGTYVGRYIGLKAVGSWHGLQNRRMVRNTAEIFD